MRAEPQTPPVAMRLLPTRSALVARVMTLCVLLVLAHVAVGETTRNILFIVDGSGSMWGQIEGESKIAITRRVFAERIKNLAPGVSTGLIAYGHRRDKDCDDIQTLVDVGPLDKTQLLARLAAINPRSMTPIAASVGLAVQQIRDLPGSSSIILMTDGKETCDADPCAVVKALKRTASFELHVVGFDVADELDVKQLQCIADAGGGSYFTAGTVAGLDEAFAKATAQSTRSADDAGDFELAQQNTQIVLDTSAAMRQPFDGSTRLAAAGAALRAVLQLQGADHDNLGFRRFGGPCDGNNTERVLDFAKNNAPLIAGSLAQWSGDGESTLIDAVNAAISDFEPAEKFADANRRIVVITGGSDPCHAHVKATALIRQRLENRHINPDFRFIGIDLPPDKEQELARVAAATDGNVSIVRSRAELQNQLERILEVEPAVDNINTIAGNFNQLIERVGEVVNALGRANYDEVQAGIAQMRTLSGLATPAFEDLTRRRSNTRLTALADNATRLRVIQLKMIDTVGQLLTHHRAGDSAAYNTTVAAYNELTREYAAIAASASDTIAALRAGVGLTR